MCFYSKLVFIGGFAALGLLQGCKNRAIAQESGLRAQNGETVYNCELVGELEPKGRHRLNSNILGNTPAITLGSVRVTLPPKSSNDLASIQFIRKPTRPESNVSSWDMLKNAIILYDRHGNPARVSGAVTRGDFEADPESARFIVKATVWLGSSPSIDIVDGDLENIIETRSNLRCD